MTDYEFHPIADLFPMMPKADLEALAADIKANGLQMPVELLDGKIIDGRNRYRACEIADIEPTFVNVQVDDPVVYVLSRNLHRRHLSLSQRAMIAVKVKDHFAAEAKKRMLAGKKSDPRVTLPQGRTGKARDQAGAVLGVSGSLVDRATKVLTDGVPELVEQVESGKLSVTPAAKASALPATRQRKFVEAIAGGKKPPTSKPSKQGPATDADGRAIPEHLREVFVVAEQFQRFAQTLSTLKGQVRQAVEADPVAWSRFSENAFRAAVAKAHDLLALSGPFIVCAYCGASDSDNCRACKGTGFLTRAQARCVPKEMRP